MRKRGKRGPKSGGRRPVQRVQRVQRGLCSGPRVTQPRGLQTARYPIGAAAGCVRVARYPIGVAPALSGAAAAPRARKFTRFWPIF